MFRTGCIIHPFNYPPLCLQGSLPYGCNQKLSEPRATQDRGQMEDFQPYQPREFKGPWREAADPTTTSCSSLSSSLDRGPQAHSQPSHLAEIPSQACRSKPCPWSSPAMPPTGSLGQIPCSFCASLPLQNGTHTFILPFSLPFPLRNVMLIFLKEKVFLA